MDVSRHPARATCGGWLMVWLWLMWTGAPSAWSADEPEAWTTTLIDTQLPVDGIVAQSAADPVAQSIATVSGQSFKKATRLDITRATDPDWVVNWSYKIPQALEPGDVVGGGIWMRSESDTGRVTYYLHNSEDPNTPPLCQDTPLTKEWRWLALGVKLPRRYAADACRVFLHLGHQPQRLQIGPMMLRRWRPSAATDADHLVTRMFPEGVFNLNWTARSATGRVVPGTGDKPWFLECSVPKGATLNRWELALVMPLTTDLQEGRSYLMTMKASAKTPLARLAVSLMRAGDATACFEREVPVTSKPTTHRWRLIPKQTIPAQDYQVFINAGYPGQTATIHQVTIEAMSGEPKERVETVSVELPPSK